MRLSVILILLLVLALCVDAAKKGKRKGKAKNKRKSNPKAKPKPPPPPPPKPIKYCVSKDNDDMNNMLEKYLRDYMKVVYPNVNPKVKAWCLAARIASAKEYESVFNYTVISYKFNPNTPNTQRAWMFWKAQEQNIVKLHPLDQYGNNEQVAFGCRWYIDRTDCLFLTDEFYLKLVEVVETIEHPKSDIVNLKMFWESLQPF